MSIIALLERGRSLSPDGVLFVGQDGDVSYDAFIEQVHAVARALGAAGIGRGDRVGVLSPNCPECLAAVYGVLASGATYVPLAGTSTSREIGPLVERMDCASLLYHPDKRALVEELTQDLPPMRLVACLDDLQAAPDGGKEDRGQPPASPRSTDIAWLGITGGTTGLPKGVQLSWRAINAFVQKFLAELPQSAPVILITTPLTHAGGMLAFPILAAGGRLVVAERFDPADFIDLVGKHRVTSTFLPPTGIYKLLDHPAVRSGDFASLRHFIYGAAPMSVTRLKEALSVFGPVMTQIYGQTECHTLIAVMRPEDHLVDGHVADDTRLSACGRPTIGTVVEIRDNDGKVAGVGETGEICVSSDLNMSGYYRSPDETASTLVDDFVLTGDVGYIDDEGFLHIVDRKKELVITGGFNVYPAEVEQVVQSHPDVAECAVVGMPDPHWGEAVTAVVRLRDGRKVTAEEIIAFARSRIGPIKAPKNVQFWQDLPKSGVGKLLRREIRAALVASGGVN